MCFIMATYSDLSHYEGFKFHLLLQSHSVFAHKLSFVWIAHIASASQSVSFCFHLYTRVLVAVTVHPLETKKTLN